MRFLLFLFFFCSFTLFAQDSVQFEIKNHFDTTQYLSQGTDFQDHAEQADGYWLFLPKNIDLQNREVMVFVHGYGGYNPMIYGKWIKHLVKQGNIIIYPRYQKNVFRPRPDKFAPNTAQAIRDALVELERQGITVNIENLTMVGHSYGGVIIADLAANFVKYEIPQPKALMLVSPGTGWLKKGRLESYAGIPPETKVIITVSSQDNITGDVFGILVYKTSEQVKDLTFFRQYPDRYPAHPISAGHNESYSVDLDFDTGVRNYTAKKALRINQVNALDYNGYWRLFDALISCQRSGEQCDLLFTSESFNLGTKPDGQALSPFEIIRR